MIYNSLSIMGIDPGLKGGVAILNGDSSISEKMPIIKSKRIVDVGALQDLLIRHKPYIVYVERQRIMSKQAGAITTGANYGRILATLELCGIDYVEVAPKEWMAVIYGKLKKGLTKQEKKQRGYDYCISRGYPIVMTSRNKNAIFHDGITDAYGIASYGLLTQRKRLVGQIAI